MQKSDVKLRLENISLDTYDLLFSRLVKEGFNPPDNARKWKSVKISISKEKSNEYKTIEIDGVFPGGQIELNNRVSHILKEIKPDNYKIRCCFKINEIDKKKICQALKDRGFVIEDYDNREIGEFCIIICSDFELSETIYHQIGDTLLPSWLLYTIRDASERDNKSINIQIFYDE